MNIREAIRAVTTGSDLETQQMISVMLVIAHTHGHAVVAISHDPAVAARGDKVYRMAAGRLTLVEDRMTGSTAGSLAGSSAVSTKIIGVGA